jgi:large subunit ribosomal protein L31
MKQNIHPPYHMVNVQMTNGETYQTRTTWGEEGAKLQLVIDSNNHPAYTGERRNIDSMGRIDKFNKKYGTTTKA